MSTATDRVAAGFALHAEALADWTMATSVVRRDVYGGYLSNGGQITVHEPLTRDDLIDHYLGRHVIGWHSTSPDNRCKVLTIDVDAHDDQADVGANLKFTLHIVAKCRSHGLRAVVLDSNGAGGYHIKIHFKKPLPSKIAYWFGRRLVADHAEFGLAKAPEVFPKQPELTLDCPFGNWVRGPGKHHKRDHWTRVLVPAGHPDTGTIDGFRWIEGEAAARYLVKIKGDKTAPIVELYDREMPAEAKAQGTGEATLDERWTATVRRNGKSYSKPDEATIRAALDYLSDDQADTYDSWLAVGMALHDWDSTAGLGPWLSFSRRSTKFDEAACREKWETFTAGAGLTIGFVFKGATARGWRFPEGATRKRREKSAKPASKQEIQDPYRNCSNADLGLKDASEVVAEEVQWGWPERSELGELTLWAGPGGQGKTLLCLWIAAKCSTGGTFPDGSTAPRGRILIVSAEDSPETTLKPRLAALGADMAKITFLKPKVTTKAEDGTERVHPQSFQDINYWRAVLARKPDTVMLFVDPLPSYLGQGVDDHRNGEVRAVLERFVSEVIRPAGIMLQATTHSSKRTDAAEAIHKVIGSVAYTNLARNVHLVAGDPDDPGRSFARQDKANHAPRDVEALEFRIAPVEVEVDGKTIKTVTIEEARCVERGSVGYAFDGAGKKRGRKKGGEVRDRVIRWLYRALDDALPDGVQVKDLVAKARDDGLLDIPSAENTKPSISALYKAKDDLSRLYPKQEVVEVKDGNRAFWCLSPRTADDAEAEEVRDLDSDAPPY